jgi:hemerythrin-like domain-containing protein
MPGLDDPLRVLFSSHDRIRFHIGALKQLASELPLHGASARARATAGEVMRFFDSAAMQHHEGEERDLFPAMLAATPAKAAPQVHALIAVLEKEHRQLAAGWNSLREELARIAAGSMGNVDVEWVAAYECLYDGHIEREEVQLLPLAGMLLTKDQLLKVGAAMSLRRSSRR